MMRPDCHVSTQTGESFRDRPRTHSRDSAYRRIRDRLQFDVSALASRVMRGLSVAEAAATTLAAAVIRMQWIFF